MAIDVGSPATDRASNGYTGNTIIVLDNPANASGTITSVEVWSPENMADCIVGTFFLLSGTYYKCRDSEAIGSVTAGAKRTFPVSINVVAGDFIGMYIGSGAIERDTEGYSGIYRVSGEHIDPDDEANYTLDAGDTVSLYATGTEPGWTGKISGVTNPAKIMGVSVANISKVKGVSSS